MNFIKIKKINISVVILFVLIVLITVAFSVHKYTTDSNLHGMWYLYSGNDILTDENMLDNFNSSDFIIFDKTLNHSFYSDGRTGEAAYEKRGNKLFIGDAIYTYEISELEHYIVLFLRGENTKNQVYVSAKRGFGIALEDKK